MLSEQCKKAIANAHLGTLSPTGGLTFDQLQAFSANAIYLDGGLATVRALPSNTIGGTVAGSSAPALTIPGTNPTTASQIVINAAFYEEGDPGQSALLIHELLHDAVDSLYQGWQTSLSTDGQIAQQLIGGPGNAPWRDNSKYGMMTASEAITEFFLRGCGK